MVPFLLCYGSHQHFSLAISTKSLLQLLSFFTSSVLSVLLLPFSFSNSSSSYSSKARKRAVLDHVNSSKQFSRVQ